MRLAIPNPPRKVRLLQVPGAVRRLSVACAVALALVALLGALGRWAGGWLSAERGFLGRAVPVDGTVAGVKLPPLEEREGGEATLEVLYAFGGRQLSATGVKARALDAERLGKGATVALLVDPRDPDRPREARFARAAKAVDLLPYGALLGAALALALILREVRWTVRAELEPLRRGMLVWLTPQGELPETRAEIVFPASYYRQDVRYEVRARIRPGRAPVRNGEKVLAAVVPAKPSWARVIDEDLARELGWFA